MIKIDNYNLISKISEKKNISTYICEDINKNKYFIHLFNLSNKIGMQNFYYTLNIQSRIKHNLISKYIKHGIDNEHFYILTEYFDGQSLFNYLNNHSVDDYDTFSSILTQILDVISISLGNKNYYFDLNLNNIFIIEKSLFSKNNKIIIVNLDYSESIEQNLSLQSTIGDINYLHKNILHYQLYKVGLLLFQILFGKVPEMNSEILLNLYINDKIELLLKERTNCSGFPNYLLSVFKDIFSIDKQKSIKSTVDLRNLFLNPKNEETPIFEIRDTYDSSLIHSFCDKDKKFEYILAYDTDEITIYDMQGIIEKREKNKCLAQISSNYSFTAVALSKDEKFLMTAGLLGGVQLWSTESMNLIKEIKGNKIIINSIDYYAPGSLFAYCGYSREVTHYDNEDGSIYNTNDFDGKINIFCTINQKEEKHIYIKNYDQLLLIVKFNPINGSLLCNTKNKELTLFDSANMKSIKTINHEHEKLTTFIFNSAGTLIVCADTKGYISVISVEDGKTLRKFKGHEGIISNIVFSPDEKFLVSGGWDKSVKFWDTEDWRAVRNIEELQFPVSSIAFAKNGKTFAVCYGYKLIKRLIREMKNRIAQLKEEEKRNYNRNNDWGIEDLADFLGYDGDLDGLSEGDIWERTGH